MIKFSVVSENRSKRREILGEHGLSILIEVDGFKLMMDAGQTGAFAKNAMEMGLDISQVNALVLSHGHYDHTGGVPEFCMINSKASIYISKNAFCERYNEEEGKSVGKPIGIPWDIEEIEGLKSRIVFSEGFLNIRDNIMLSGEVPRNLEYQKPSFVKKRIDGSFEKDTVIDEQFIIIKGNCGLYVFLGCSHPGILNCISYTKELFPQESIWGVVGGMHLNKWDDKSVDELAYEFSKMGIHKVFPMHCTGLLAGCYLRNSFKENCILLSCGDQFVLES